MKLLGLFGLASSLVGGNLVTWGLGAALAGAVGWGALSTYRLTGARADLADERARAADERAAGERSAREFQARNMVTRSIADAALSATEQRLNAALQESINAPPKPFTCPQGGDIWSAPVPGLADELRRIHAAEAAGGGGDTGAGVAPVPPASAPGR